MASRPSNNMKITDLEPKLVWQCFDEITHCARPIHHLDKMKEFPC